VAIASATFSGPSQPARMEGSVTVSTMRRLRPQLRVRPSAPIWWSPGLWLPSSRKSATPWYSSREFDARCVYDCRPHDQDIREFGFERPRLHDREELDCSSEVDDIRLHLVDYARRRAATPPGEFREA